jgi:hypothetical protein
LLAVNDFFEPPPVPPASEEPEPPPTPPWFGAPRGMLPGVVALELVLARTERAAVCVSRIDAYPTGFEFVLRAVAAPGQRDDMLDPMLFGPARHRARGRGGTGLPDDMLRIGVEFADGAKATNTGGYHTGENAPRGPVMHDGGGGGGGREWHQDEWVWPLPPAGPLAFVCEWPAAEIPLSRTEIDAQTILDAAARARPVFPGPGGQRADATWSSGIVGTKQEPSTSSFE